MRVASFLLLGAALQAYAAEPPERLTSTPPGAAQSKRAPIAPNVWLEVNGGQRRVGVNAKVCLREGLLEHLMCRAHTKEHEAVLSADADARDIHKALLVAGAKPGSPVRYEPTFRAPSGTPIRITLQYEQDGKWVTVPAQQMVRDVQTRKALDQDWVFAGSVFVTNTFEKEQPPLYAANGGDVICVANFEGAMLDLPINSSKDNTELSFEAFTEHIPPLGTKVVVYLEPRTEDKAK
jgi:hypothetical protein